MCLTEVSGFPPKCTRHDVGWSQGLCPSPLLAWHFACFRPDLSRSFCLSWSKSLPIQAPSPSFPSEVSNLFSKYGGQASIFPLIWSQCDGASWQLPTGVVPAHGVAMDTSLSWPEVLRPPANLYGTSSQAHLLVMSLNVL